MFKPNIYFGMKKENLHHLSSYQTSGQLNITASFGRNVIPTKSNATFMSTFVHVHPKANALCLL